MPSPQFRQEWRERLREHPLTDHERAKECSQITASLLVVSGDAGELPGLRLRYLSITGSDLSPFWLRVVVPSRQQQLQHDDARAGEVEP